MWILPIFCSNTRKRGSVSPCLASEVEGCESGPLLFSLSACEDSSTLPQSQGPLGSAQLLLPVLLLLVGTVLWLTFENRRFWFWNEQILMWIWSGWLCHPHPPSGLLAVLLPLRSPHATSETHPTENKLRGKCQTVTLGPAVSSQKQINKVRFKRTEGSERNHSLITGQLGSLSSIRALTC